MRIRKWVIGIICLALLPGSIYANEQKKELPQTVMQTYDGKTITVKMKHDGLIFENYKDKIVLLEFFGHSCPPCRASIPGYNRLQHDYGKEVKVIAVESWSLGKDKLKEYVKQMDMHYDVVATSDAGEIFTFVQKLVGWTPNYGVPFLMLFKPGGTMAKYVPPQGLDESYVKGLIEQIKKEQAVMGIQGY